MAEEPTLDHSHQVAVKGPIIKTLRTVLAQIRNGGMAEVLKRDRPSDADLKPVTRPGAEQRLPDFPEARPLNGSIQEDRLTVATLVSEPSSNAWRYEWECVALEPTKWLQQLQRNPVSLLFVESFWADGNSSWTDTGWSPNAQRQELSKIVDWCKASGIPTVFWTKETEPYHVELFHAAKTFDVILAADATMVEEYSEKLQHSRVHPLEPAAQPKLHNPVRPESGHQTRDVAFAGTHSPSKSPDLHQEIELVLRGAHDASSKMAHGLEMFVEKPEGNATPYPPVLNPRMVGSLEYGRRLSAYKAYKCFVSSTFREVVEVTASGTPVLAAQGLTANGGFTRTLVPAARTREEAASLLRSLVQSKELRDRTVHLGQRQIWQEHTYAHRAAQVLTAAGVTRKRTDPLSMTEVPKISALVSSIRPEQISHILKTVGKQSNVDVELVLVAHGFEPNESNIRAEAFEYGLENVVVLQESLRTSLGYCLNSAITAASGTYVAKMDDDDIYGPCYLQDQAAALRYSGANVCGKQAHYMYLAGPGVTLLRFGQGEHRFTDFVMGPTLFTTRETLQETPFRDLNSGEDSDFLRRITQSGGNIYSSDRFNFIQMRSGDGDGHTWSVKEEDLMATGVVAFYGMNEEHIVF